MSAKIIEMKEPLKKDLKYNWHPYTQMKDHETLPPIFIKKAKGIKLFDDNGTWYYDTISSWWCNVHGHNHPHITKAVNKQLKKLDHVPFAGFTHEPAIKLSEKLISIAPKGLTRVFYSDNGSTAVETAVKMSLQYWNNIRRPKKNKFVHLDLGYHGDTAGTMSLGGVDIFNKVFTPLFFKSYKVPTPYCYRCPVKKERKDCAIECIKPLEKLLEEKNKEISAFIIEPMVLGAAGMIIYPVEYLKKAYKLCKKYNVHFIADEVASGFGRTGKMFACEWAGISPDFLCLSKGLTSGILPLAATLTTRKVYKAFYSDFKDRKTFYHGHTFTANPTGCSVALASLEIFDKEKTLKNVKNISKQLSQAVKKFKVLPFAGDIRTIGSIFAIELVKDKRTKEPFRFEDRVGYKIYKEGLKHNLILRPIGDVIYLFLPLSTDSARLNEILAKTRRVLAFYDR
ncbi:MAG: adenosylmethionine--8-amino-7-oxononanoate transaminase [Candidatus Saganbacteria bacterium]|nr:adenosylmethionine--8-amino-7-oxononanoate transaminase [Candidatus Saganbacteria bacterium]